MTDRAVFLDRDGVVNRERGFVSHPDEIELVPGLPDALSRLRELGFRILVVSNQSGLARGLLTFANLQAIHARIRELTGNAIDGFYVCPHHPSEGRGPLTRDCPCRKPKPGLLRQAAKEWRLDLRRSWLIGDAPRDAAAAQAAGVRTALLLGPKVPDLASWPDVTPPETVAGDIGTLAKTVAAAH